MIHLGKEIEEAAGKTATTVVDLQAKQHELGQFLTPPPVAQFMASLFVTQWREVELLDAGAGAGALTQALVHRLCGERRKPKRIAVTAFELDASLIEPLQSSLADCQRRCEAAGIVFSSIVRNENFINAAVSVVRDELFAPAFPLFNIAIVNPPYRKIRSDSPERLLLRSANIESSNLYAGFVALITRLMVKGGELVAITPRSFCNGPYFRLFRSDFLDAMSIQRLHVFESRSAAFIEDEVLQENVIVHAVKNGQKPKRVVISTSSGAPGGAISESEVAYTDVVSPDDPERFVHLTFGNGHTDAKAAMQRLPSSLADLGLSVSTGRIVDFRAASYLRRIPGKDTAPLIYPCHFNGGFVRWPKENCKKHNAIVCNEKTRELLVPAGIYVLVKRFTAKEERRRLMASIYDPKHIHSLLVGFENHLNYFHIEGHGMSMNLAKGLTAFLNSTIVDLYFRQFSGHTQVNATDLRSLSYPSTIVLERFGETIDDPGMPQETLDDLVEKEMF